ncbi:MAG: kynureninase [Gammaproteobacteria bacterium]|nr:kynureninase [Gammaproteobacteria bacterium]
MTLEAAIQRDREDLLASTRQLFDLPGDIIYLNGNSLGPLAKAVKYRLKEVLERQWGEDLISSWNRHGWIDLPLSVGKKIAPLIGARPDEVLCCDSVSVNLFKLLCCALNRERSRQPGGKVNILTQQENFPTDLYIAQGFSELMGDTGVELVVAAESDLKRQLQEVSGIVLLTQVNFRTGKLLDIECMTNLAHEQGSLVIWDLSHSAGVLPLALSDWQVDYAVGCGYKYLNGGPGAPAFLYVNQTSQQAIKQPLQGWMGHKAPFIFSPSYDPAAGIRQLQCGTPDILSMSALDAALDCFAEVAVADLRSKSLALAETFLVSLWSNQIPNSFSLISPVSPAERGAQLSFSHVSAHAISQALAEQGVITDFRSPDVLRLGFSPLFLSFQQCWKAGNLVARTIIEKLYLNSRFELQNRVT